MIQNRREGVRDGCGVGMIMTLQSIELTMVIINIRFILMVYRDVSSVVLLLFVRSFVCRVESVCLLCPVWDCVVVVQPRLGIAVGLLFRWGFIARAQFPTIRCYDDRRTDMWPHCKQQHIFCCCVFPVAPQPPLQLPLLLVSLCHQENKMHSFGVDSKEGGVYDVGMDVEPGGGWDSLQNNADAVTDK